MIDNGFYDHSLSERLLSALAERPVSEVCPSCKREVAVHHFECDGHPLGVVGTCVEHGTVTPIRSAVVNRM